MSARPLPRQKLKHRRFTREELLRNLAIIGTISAPLPPDLPPSPPASRSVSPEPFIQASSSKRKLDTISRVDSDSSSKRQRLAEKPHKHHSNFTASNSVDSHKVLIRGSDSNEDGELREEGPSNLSIHTPSNSLSSTKVPPEIQAPATALVTGMHIPMMPVRRPRRGKDTQHMDLQHDKWHTSGRAFKYSGDARFWSTFPPSHKHFKPLQNPPPAGSLYHTHGGLMSRLELVDGLICFVYSLWCRDYVRGNCINNNWNTISQYLSWCKQKWMQENAIGVREKAFLGLINMIEAFIHQRKVQYAVMTHIENDMNALAKRLPKPEDLARAARAAIPVQPTMRATPGMLPSPANTLGSNSANSTPSNPSGGGTPPNPEVQAGASGLAVSLQPPPPTGPPPLPLVPPEASVPQPLLWELKEIVEDQNAAAYCMKIAQQHLSLSTMREHFPRTFDRMIYSSLTAQDEHEPDLEDDEGELLWPGQCVTGEGLGWVCLMGSAMVKEFGKDVGYRGIEGTIPKP